MTCCEDVSRKSCPLYTMIYVPNAERAYSIAMMEYRMILLRVPLQIGPRLRVSADMKKNLTGERHLHKGEMKLPGFHVPNLQVRF